MASGPSMTRQDAEAVMRAGFKTIVVNNTFALCPEYDVLMAGDTRWWKAYGYSVVGNGKRFSRSFHAEKRYKAKVFKGHLGSAYNSGQLAIEYAILKNPALIVLLGFDGSVDHGIHHHGPHQKTPNPNPARCRRWQPQFKKIVETYPDAPIVNCSRYTVIDAFPRASLEDVLCGRFSI